jgi:uncharacterized membrane protein
MNSAPKASILMSTETPPPVTSAPATEDRTVAILSYVTIIGFIAAIVIHSSKKTQLGAFHLRQALGLIVTLVALSLIAIIPILGWLVFLVGWITVVVLAIIGFIGAINGTQKPVPILGEKYQKWFATAFV